MEIGLAFSNSSQYDNNFRKAKRAHDKKKELSSSLTSETEQETFGSGKNTVTSSGFSKTPGQQSTGKGNSMWMQSPP